MKVRYIGGHPAVEIPGAGMTVEHGAEVDLDEALAKELLEREDWEAVKKGAKS